MGLPKNRTNNPHGRPKGSVNKVTKTTRDWVQGLIDGNRSKLEKDLKELEPKERWQVIERLMQYTLPKMASVEAKIDLNNLTETQLDTIITELSNKINDENTD